jgi:5-methylcytosine-specific restriction endonuclease McrA
MAKPTEPYSGPIVTRVDARAFGLKKFFTGKPCCRGHIAERYINGGCVPCALAKAAVWHEVNPERAIEISAAWDERHPDGRSAISAKWRGANRQLAVARTLASKAKKPAEYSCKARRWRHARPDLVAATKRRRRARLAGAEGSHTASELVELFEKQKGRCWHCLKRITMDMRKPNAITEDHWVSLSAGGSNWISNIRLSCRPCNASKGTSDPLAFARKNGRLL